MNKKEIKMLRNRLSAQRSRDRKKKEFNDLRLLTKNLLKENEILRKEIKNKDNKINDLVKLLCSNCSKIVEEKYLKKKENQGVLSTEIIDENNRNNQLTSNNLLLGKKKMAFLMTSLLAVFCLFGLIINPNEKNLDKNIRQLKDKNFIVNINSKAEEKRINLPFIIEKDYSIRHKKEKETVKNKQNNNSDYQNLLAPASLFENKTNFLSIGKLNLKGNIIGEGNLKTDNLGKERHKI